MSLHISYINARYKEKLTGQCRERTALCAFERELWDSQKKDIFKH